MKNDDSLDFGSVQVHKKVLADIVSSAINDIEGVSLITKTLSDYFGELLGRQNIPGVEVVIDENHEVTIDVKVIVRYGLNIPDMARQIQETIKAVIAKTVDIHLKSVNINIQGIERGQK
ncbi:MAG TPA: hypothetical protein DD723_03935 [Candidatus Omnitrophica bacterium]|nr:MAG: hypothetical protein A2Z81_00365 [Omnitrophica WOR_2 bacterium GWA2_45_18]OGX19645.1 MAG: hypothetical protein A2Y04_02910 [Omnitrophica WOR_2 bacterium GWC2_45_7]HBR14681.1 hypothetical protein [Candidatus Omnitrophota bacterium]